MTIKIKRSVSISNTIFYLKDLRELVEATKDYSGNVDVRVTHTEGDRPYSSSTHYTIEVSE